MDILHISAECFPAAKVGGLADVVGALPKYLNRQGVHASVIMPKYATDWIQAHNFTTVFEGEANIGRETIGYAIQVLEGNEMGFPLFVVNIPDFFERPGIYVDPFTGSGYWDELERFLSFQVAVLDWILSKEDKPDLVHCHDHHTALIPFMMTECFKYDELKAVPTVLTIHNANYHGTYDFTKGQLLPDFNLQKAGLLEWNEKLNSLAAGLKCAWQITTVSETYMKELAENSNGLELLFQSEKQKSMGIINGIDIEVWNPETDSYLDHHYSIQTRTDGKAANKKELCARFELNPAYPTVSFIGRLVHQKGADLLPDVFKQFFAVGKEVNFIVLGSGDPALHERFHQMNEEYVGFFDATLDYNEELAHHIYAGSDFMVIPSRFEPCGLNQMYSMRYGTIPIVRNVGGLKDTVVDINEEGGYGFVFEEFSVEAAFEAVERALNLYENGKRMDRLRKRIMELNFSWNASAKQYISMYNEVLDKK
ncbi:MAG: glycogen/starch synthase [Balneolaceae bacterium]|nr:glycogen/starch synthase [Balneolaceae bacterium]